MEPYLTAEERTQLRLAHRHQSLRRYADRIKTVLAIDAGHSYEAIADMLLIDESTARRYFDLYKKKGLAGLTENKFKGSSGKLTRSEIGELKDWVQETTPKSTHHVQAFLEQEFKVELSRSAIAFLLKRLGFSYIKPKVRPGRASDEIQNLFVKAYEKLKISLGPQDRIYFGDAAHPIHNARADYGWMVTGSPKVLKTNSGRSRINLNGAVDPYHLDVVVRQEPTMNAEAVINLFKVLEARTPQQGVIHFISDNASYYHSSKVKAWLRNSRIQLHFLPAYSPNLNLAERLWKKLRSDVLGNIYYETFADFKEACASYFRKLRRNATHLADLFSDRFQTLPSAT